MKFKTPFIVAVSVYFVNELLGRAGVYHLFPNTDIPMHLAGGFAMAMFGIALYERGMSKSVRQKTPKWFAYIFIVGFSLLVGVLWEFHEWFLDHTLHTWNHSPFFASSNDDTMKDLLDDWIGASAAFLLLFAEPVEAVRRMIHSSTNNGDKKRT